MEAAQGEAGAGGAGAGAEGGRARAGSGARAGAGAGSGGGSPREAPTAADLPTEIPTPEASPAAGEGGMGAPSREEADMPETAAEGDGAAGPHGASEEMVATEGGGAGGRGGGAKLVPPTAAEVSRRKSMTIRRRSIGVMGDPSVGLLRNIREGKYHGGRRPSAWNTALHANPSGEDGGCGEKEEAIGSVSDDIENEYVSDASLSTDGESDEEWGDGEDESSPRYLEACARFGAKPVSQVLKYFPHDEMIINHYGIGVRGMKALVHALKVNRTLTALHLKDNSLNEEGTQVLCEGILGNPQIEYLDLSMNKIGIRGAICLAELLKPSSGNKIVSLSVHSNRLTDRDILPLASTVGKSERLSNLDVSRNNFGEKGAVAFANSFAESRSLRTVNISWNTFFSRGCEAIAQALKLSQTLRRLDLSRCGVPDDGAEMLLEDLPGSVLEEFNLSGNAISEEVAARLLEACPNNMRLNLEQQLPTGKSRHW